MGRMNPLEEAESEVGAFKTEMKGAGIVLRFKTPAGAEQEVWALLCAYHAIRELICAAAALASQDPLRISFVNALDVVRGPVGNPGSFPPRRPDNLQPAALRVLAAVTSRRRPG